METATDNISRVSMTAMQVTNQNTNNNSRVSEAGPDDPFASKLPWGLDVGLACYMLIITVSSILLNGTVLGTITFRKRKLVTLEIYIVNMSAIDLLHAVVAHPLMVVSAFKHAWPLSETVCHRYAATVFFLGTASISTLATMSVMRYIKVCHPDIDKHISIRVGAVILIPIYLNASVWSIAPLLGWASYGPEPFGLSCTIDWFNPSTSYTICIFMGVYVIPVAAMVGSYGKMVYTVYKAQSNSCLFRTKMDRYLTKMAIVMCSCFMLAWTPYAVVALIYVFCPKMHVPYILTVMAPFFAKSSTCYNPIIYFLCIKRFRNDALEVFFPQCVTKVLMPQTEEVPSKLIPLHHRKPRYKIESSTDQLSVKFMTKGPADINGSNLTLLSQGSKICRNNNSQISDTEGTSV